MSRVRAFTDTECAELAQWAAARGSFKDKAAELGVSVGTLRDAILRGQGKDPGYIRRKIQLWLSITPRETIDKSRIDSTAEPT